MKKANYKFFGCLLITICCALGSLIILTAIAYEGQTEHLVDTNWDVYNPFAHPYIALLVASCAAGTWGLLIYSGNFPWPEWKREPKGLY